MDYLHCDFESRSTLDLKQVGLWNYARHASTDVWCVAWAIGDAEPQIVAVAGADSPECPAAVRDHIHAGKPVVAHNAPFELAIWNGVMSARYGWPELKAEQTYCTMSQCYAAGLPGGLDGASHALGLDTLKDSEGHSLMLRMARPRRMEGETPIWWDDPDKTQRLFAYCQQDVRVERQLHRRLPPLSPRERDVWLMDYQINQRGVAVDVETAAAGARMAATITERAGARLAEITNGAVASPSALLPLKSWVAEQGVTVDSLDKESISLLLSGALPDAVRQALTIRQETGKASVAKLNRIQELAGDDSRLHNWGQYHGATTGRWAARGVQVHNLVRDMPPIEVLEDVLSAVRHGEVDWISMAYGPPMSMVSRCLRGFFVASPGKTLVGGDFASVESRGTAWISGEDWKLRAFRDADAKRGPGIYELTAHRTLGIPLAEITKDSEARQIGKLQELSFGFGGGLGAVYKFLPASMSGTPESVMEEWKHAWRAAHPNIVKTWRALERAAIAAVLAPGTAHSAGQGKRGVTFKKAGSFLWCRLPSGRVMCYPYPKLLAGQFGDRLTYMAAPSALDIKRRQMIDDPKNSNTWARVGTYGESLMENVVQALCRDLLADKMTELHGHGAAIVMHVHDEILLEVADEKAEAARSFMQATLRTPPAWADGFPLWATCETMKRYHK